MVHTASPIKSSGTPHGRTTGATGRTRRAEEVSTAAFERFPDIHVTIEDIFAEGDKLVVRNKWQAMDHDGPEN
jgi:hypothetical protein